MSSTEAPRDRNWVPVLLWYNENTGDVQPIKIDPTTWRLRVSWTWAWGSPLTTKGDIYIYSTVDDRLPVGADWQVLQADSTTITWLRWWTGWGWITTYSTVILAETWTWIDNDLMYCVETETFYRYELTGGWYTVDDTYILSTWDGWDTRWVWISWQYVVNNINTKQQLQWVNLVVEEWNNMNPAIRFEDLDSWFWANNPDILVSIEWVTEATFWTDWLSLKNWRAINWILDEDDMVSDSETSWATQQSIKAYVDNKKKTITSISSDYSTQDEDILNILTSSSPWTSFLTGWTATAQETFAWTSPANVVDGNLSTHWGNDNHLPVWWKYDLWSWNSEIVKKYEIYISDDITAGWRGSYEYAPSEWTLDGSNDNTNWTTIDTQTGQSWSTDEWKSYTTTWNTSSYRYYRINITDNNWTHNRVHLIEVKMYDSATTWPLWVTLSSADCVAGKTLVIKDSWWNAGINNIIITTEWSETIDWWSSYTIGTNYMSINVYSDWTNWFIY